jgi:2-haloacid dehalogenase
MPLKALFFDVFGTCVDWRKTVTEGLIEAAKESGDTTMVRPFQTTHHHLTKLITTQPQSPSDWASFAQEWRTSYLTFTRSIATNPSLPYKTVDQHHHDSLLELLSTHNLPNLFSPSQINNLTYIWHRLAPWPDTNAGLAALHKDLGLQTATLTNGNLTLITNMVNHSGMPFQHILSAEMFDSYKPNPKVYLGAAEKLGFEPGECAMVAAHLEDLAAAKECGFRTVYVERKEEERAGHLREREGLVDVWVREEEEGFVEAARKLGVWMKEEK